MNAHLASLLEVLPDPREMVTGDDLDYRARAVLAWFAVQALEADVVEPVTPDPRCCPNCGEPCAHKTSPYCSDRCRAESAFVRQLRRGLVEGGAFDAGRQTMIGESLWHLLGGGYPRRQALVDAKGLQRVFAREHGRCQECGAPAVTVDHAGSG